MTFDATTLGRLIEIVWINISLSGDNAVVIALACQHLPREQRKWGIILGTAPAVAVLIGSAAVISYLMQINYLRLVGGLMLLWIAVKLLKTEDAELQARKHGTSLWAAVRTIVVADVIMSLDNVLAIAGAVLIGYVAGDVAVEDPVVAPRLGPTLATIIPFVTAALVLPVGLFLTRLARHRAAT